MVVQTGFRSGIVMVGQKDLTMVEYLVERWVRSMGCPTAVLKVAGMAASMAASMD